MAEPTRQQDDMAQHLAHRYGRSRTMQVGNGSVIIFGMSEETTLCRLHVEPSGAARPATKAELDRAWRLSLAHVRIPCDACGYPARSPRCVNCGGPVGHRHNAADAA